MSMMENKRHHSETLARYRVRQLNMKLVLKEQKQGKILVPMRTSQRQYVQRGVRGLRTHHNPDTNYGSLSKHKRWAAIRQNKPAKLALVEKGMARLHKAFNINI